jgi:hypothetical protein
VRHAVIPVWLLLVAARSAAAQPVRHVPPAEAVAGAQIELVAEAPANTPTLVAHVRTTGQAQFQTIELVKREDARWVAVVPATLVAPPGLDYYLDAGGEAVFATPVWPHTLIVHAADDEARKSRDMLRSAGRRSRVHTMGEWVEYGSRRVGMTKLTDHYYRIDADFSYRLWAYPLEELRIGYTRLLGETPSSMCAGNDPCTHDAGFKVAGWFELGLAAVEGIRLDARMSVLATQDGFNVGGRGEARLGDRDASHVAVGVEYLADVGTSGYFRLGWGTVPKLPMSATVEVTNLPDRERETGVRLYYDLGVMVAAGTRAGIRVGYAARNQSVAGFTGGAGLTVDF